MGVSFDYERVSSRLCGVAAILSLMQDAIEGGSDDYRTSDALGIVSDVISDIEAYVSQEGDARLQAVMDASPKEVA